MPPVIPNPDRKFLYAIRKLQGHQRRASQQQNRTISDTNFNPVMNLGLIPVGAPNASGALDGGEGAAPLYGLQHLNPGTGDQVIMLGQQSDGTYGLWVFAPGSDGAPGPVLIKLNDNGLAVLNASGDVVAQLTASGLAVLNAVSGTMQNVNAINAVQGSSGSVSGTTYEPIANSSLTVTVGPSGQVWCSVSAYIIAGGDTTGSIAVFLDGAIVPGYTSMIGAGNSGSGIIGVSASATLLFSAITPGQHTFSLQAKSSNTTSITYSAPALVIQPL